MRPEKFSLEGRGIRKVRQSVTRLGREGYGFRVVAAGDVDTPLREELERVSAAWRGSNVERGFSMAMDDQFREPDTFFAIAERNGTVGGFLHVVPSGRGFSLGAMRRRRDTPNGLMEYLIVELLGWARERDAEEISLNFCVFGDLLAGDTAQPARGRRACVPARLRPSLPTRAAARVQPEVHARVAPEVPLRRTALRPAARRSCVPPSGVAADAAGPVDSAATAFACPAGLIRHTDAVAQQRPATSDDFRRSLRSPSGTASATGSTLTG